MAYIGTSPSNGVRRRFVYVATANQTSFSGNDENGISLVYVDVAYLDVYQNGVKLKSVDDYASTTGTSVVLVQGASADDVVEIIAFDVFSIGDTVSAADGGSFGGNIGIGGTLSVTGNVVSPITLGGTTPTLTIGDAGAEDAKIVFDGNAQDFHIGLDDTADDLVIGKGSALGTTPVISIADTLKTTFGGGAIGATYAVATSGNITMNFDLYTNFQITATGGNVALLNGTGTLTSGQSGVIVLIQDGTGSRTLSTGSDYEWPAATLGTISTAASAVDVIPYYIDANDSILLGAPQIGFATPS